MQQSFRSLYFQLEIIFEINIIYSLYKDKFRTKRNILFQLLRKSFVDQISTELFAAFITSNVTEEEFSRRELNDMNIEIERNDCTEKN